MTTPVSIEEIAALIGQKDIEILYMQKQITALQKRIAELEPKDETKQAP